MIHDAIGQIAAALADPATKGGPVINIEMGVEEWRALVRAHRSMAAGLRKIRKVSRSIGGTRTEEGEIAIAALRKAGV